MIYLDNAATSWPKPDRVHAAMWWYLRDVGANPGRSGHRLANQAERIRFDARETIAELFGVSDPTRVVFALNATEALNLVMQGLLAPGTHAVTTGMEHNAVMRPLRALERRGVSVSIVPCRPDGTMDPTGLDDYVRPETRLIVANHASNVCGTVLPIREIGAMAQRHGIPFLVDAAQTGGCWPIDLKADNIDLLAFTGHKGMLGPSGTGGLAIRDDFDIDTLPPLVCGGTGSRSEYEVQPDFLPDKYEAGTPNIVGLAGLAAGVQYVLKKGVNEIRVHERALTQRLIDGLGDIAGVRVVGTQDAQQQTAVVSFTIDGQSVSDTAHCLDEQFGIMCRPGLHCAPRAHRTLGTLPDGTVRFAPGRFNTQTQIDQVIDAVAHLAGGESHE
jgi:cysteine desulfurase/selenocysteine lyase